MPKLGKRSYITVPYSLALMDITLLVKAGVTGKSKGAMAFRNINFSNMDIAQMSLYVDVQQMETEEAANQW